MEMFGMFNGHKNRIIAEYFQLNRYFDEKISIISNFEFFSLHQFAS